MIRNILILLSFIIFSSCEDIFLRFKYETFECKKNNFKLDKISIKDDSVGSSADVQFGDIYYSIKIVENDKKYTVLKNNDLDIEITIHKINERVDVRLKNNVTRLSCKKNTFKM